MLPQYSGILEMHTEYRLSKLKKHQSGISPNLMPFPFKPNVFQSLLSDQKIQLIHSQPITVKWTRGKKWNFKVIFALWPIYKQSTPLYTGWPVCHDMKQGAVNEVFWGLFLMF